MMQKDGAQNKKESTWLILFMAIPAAMAVPASDLFDASGITSTLIAATIGGLGGLVGFGGYYLVKNQSNGVRGLALAGQVVLLIGGLLLIKSSLAPSEVPYDDWQDYELGLFSFASPHALEQTELQVPEGQNLITDVDLWTYEMKGKLIGYMHWECASDTMQVVTAFDRVLSTMLNKLPYTPTGLEFEVLDQLDDLLEVNLQWLHEGDTLKGYGMMVKKEKLLESMWLLPLNESFSDMFIEDFGLNVVPDLDWLESLPTIKSDTISFQND